MTICKNKGIIYSEYFLQLLSNSIDNDKLTIRVEVLDNCREQGYTMRVRDNTFSLKGLTFYVYAQRYSDEPTITWENKIHFDNMFTEEAWTERTESRQSVEEIVQIAIDLIKKEWK